MICNAEIKIMATQDLRYPEVESFVPDLLYYLNCMKFGQLILMKLLPPDVRF